jgi:hypothetical protein
MGGCDVPLVSAPEKSLDLPSMGSRKCALTAMLRLRRFALPVFVALSQCHTNDMKRWLKKASIDKLEGSGNPDRHERDVSNHI